MSAITKIEQTKEYKKFKSIVGNRALKTSQLNKLENSILKNNLLHLFPIVVNEKFQVIDGQKRFYLSAKNGWVVNYVQQEGLTMDDARLINSSLSSWSLRDYLESQIAQGNKDYIELQEFMDTYTIPPALSLSLLVGTTSQVKSIKRSFQSGDYKITHKDYACEMGDLIVELTPYLSTAAVRTHREFIRALGDIKDKLNIKEFKKNLADNGRLIQHQTSRRDYILQFESLISYGKSKPIRLV